MSTITNTEYKQLQDENTPHTLIDVRELDEWNQGHISHAIHIPLGILTENIEASVPDKSSLLVLHCASGRRSGLGVDALQKMGYTKVKNLLGGYNEYI